MHELRKLYIDYNSIFRPSKEIIHRNKKAMDNIEPVSQTHLDVYKRQHWNWDVLENIIDYATSKYNGEELIKFLMNIIPEVTYEEYLMFMQK